jgi:hypothetical protein
LPTRRGLGPTRLLLQTWLAQKRAESAPLPDTSIGNTIRNTVNSLLGKTTYYTFPDVSAFISEAQPGIVNMLGQWQTWRLLEAQGTIRAFMAAVAAASLG